jgi:hypothetical protein
MQRLALLGDVSAAPVKPHDRRHNHRGTPLDANYRQPGQ